MSEWPLLHWVIGAFAIAFVAAFVGLGVIAVVLQVRVLRHLKAGRIAEFRRAMRWQNFDAAAVHLEPGGHADMARLRVVFRWLGVLMAFAAVVMVAAVMLTDGPRRTAPKPAASWQPASVAALSPAPTLSAVMPKPETG